VFVAQHSLASACTLAEAYELTEEARTYAELAKQSTRTHYLLWSQDTATEHEWEEMRKEAGEALAKKHRK
jgi:hypothetical protein